MWPYQNLADQWQLQWLQHLPVRWTTTMSSWMWNLVSQENQDRSKIRAFLPVAIFLQYFLHWRLLFQYQKWYEYGQQHTNLVSVILIKQTGFTLFTWANKVERLEYTECTMAYLVHLKMMRRFPSIAASNRLAENCFQSTMIFFGCLQAYCDVYRNLQMVFDYNCILKCT